MTRPSFRIPFAEGLAVLGVFFGAWLIQRAFPAAAQTPNLILLTVGVLDILICFGLVGYFLRQRLRDGQPLPRSWIAGSVVLLACFLGWIAALFIDSDRLRTEQEQHREIDQQVAKLEDSLRLLNDVMPAIGALDRHTWEVNHDHYARLHDQLQAPLRARPPWDKDLARVDEQMRLMQKAYNGVIVEPSVDQRLKLRTDFQQARDRAVQQTESLRTEIAQSEKEVTLLASARWHAVGASALTGVALILGCLLLWLVFDRELRRSWKARERLAQEGARFRTLIENHGEPIAVLNSAGVIQYANPAWKSAFNYDADDLMNLNLLELIHPQDRGRVASALQAPGGQPTVPCRLSADYGVYHDIEMHCQQHADGTTVVQLRDVRETPEFPLPSHDVPPVAPDPDRPRLAETTQKLRDAEAKLAELEQQCQSLRDGERSARTELQHQRWLLGAHQDAGTEGLLILSAQGNALSWNAAFVQMWKLSDETMSAHTWLTVAAHMETLARAGWDDFRKATSLPSPSGRGVGGEGALPQTDSCWEMTLEGGRLIEVYAQALRDQPQSTAAVRFHFRDVTQHNEMAATLREHQDDKKSYEADLREHEQRLRQLEKQLGDRDRQREEVEADLRDHQDRLHQMHETHESHAASIKAAKEAMRRLASGVANEFNTVLSVVLGNTDVLRENLPKDHMAQNYVDEIRQAASRGTDLSQRLLAFSRNHLLQMVPVELNEQLASLDSKLHAALGHDVQLHWERGHDELWVKTDPHPLEQALLHVVSHARQHMPNAGTLTIHARRVDLTRRDLTHADMMPGSYIQLSLKDTGAGIDDETLPHVFEPYHQITEGQKGDLTLATAYGIVRQSGGCIDVHSQPGQGTEWTILLPATDDRPHHESAPLRASA